MLRISENSSRTDLRILVSAPGGVSAQHSGPNLARLKPDCGAESVSVIPKDAQSTGNHNHIPGLRGGEIWCGVGTRAGAWVKIPRGYLVSPISRPVLSNTSTGSGRTQPGPRVAGSIPGASIHMPSTPYGIGPTLTDAASTSLPRYTQPVSLVLPEVASLCEQMRARSLIAAKRSGWSPHTASPHSEKNGTNVLSHRSVHVCGM